MTNVFDELGKRLKKSRKEIGLTLEKVAEACGLKEYQTVSSWESGNTSPSLKNLLKLCDLYGCEIGYLVGEFDCKHRKTADISQETGLSEAAVNQLRNDNTFKRSRIQALNALLEFEGGGILQDVADFLFHNFDSEVKAGNVVINGNNIADVFLLEIIGELQALRRKAKGGAGDGNSHEEG